MGVESVSLQPVVSARLRQVLLLGCAGIVAAMATGRAEFAVMASPFVVAVLTGLALTKRPQLDIDTSYPVATSLEGDEVETSVAIAPAAGSDTRRLRVEVAIEVAPALAVVDPPGGRAAWAGRTTNVDEGNRFTARLTTNRWGNHAVGPVHIRASDSFGLIAWEGSTATVGSVRVLPDGAAVRRLVAPLRTRATFGSQVTRSAGAGIELADIRPYQPGDAARNINWRTTARRGTTFVTDHHPERNADVVIMIDTFADANPGSSGAPATSSTLAQAVRGAGALAAAYLAARDRVGLVQFGGSVQWLRPAPGRRQLDNIIDRLLSARAAWFEGPRPIGVINRQALPARAMVIALTPLHDARMVDALVELRRRGNDLVVLRLAAPSRSQPGSNPPLVDAAHRLWQLELAERARLLDGIGVPVALWTGSEGLETVLSGLIAARQRDPGR